MVASKNLSNHILWVKTLVRSEILKLFFSLVNLIEGDICCTLVLHEMGPRTNDEFFELMDMV